MPAWIVFAGEMIAIGFCWIPSGILYNYLSYFFFTLGAILLYQGLVEEKDGYLLAAGFSLGFNVFVRIPNLTQMALITGLWFYLWQKKQKKAYAGCVLTMRLKFILRQGGKIGAIFSDSP